MKFRILHITLIISLITQLGYGQNLNEFFSQSDAFFGKHVKNGRVAYKAIKADPSQLNELLSMAEGITVAINDAKIFQAFWINGYNLSVIKGVLDNYPIKSPLSKKGFFDKIKYNIGGKSITLNAIENEVLRKSFPKEPRFHFALVCAGLGCPPLIAEAYVPVKLESQLQRQTKIALNNPKFVRVKGKKVSLSKIFEWYPEDFKQGGKSFIDFVNIYRTEKLDPKAKVSHYDYDWALNEQ